MQTAEKYISTTENWYPNYPDNKLKVRFCQLSTKEWRVSVWGADDFGMEKDFPKNQKMEALETYRKICDHTTEKQLEKLGFVWA